MESIAVDVPRSELPVAIQDIMPLAAVHISSMKSTAESTPVAKGKCLLVLTSINPPPGRSVVKAPLQSISCKTDMPAARPNRRLGKTSVECTYTGMDVLHGFEKPIKRSEGKAISTKEPHPDNTIQLLIDLTMDSINEAAEEELKYFDEWMEFRMMVLAKRFKHKIILDRFISQEITVFKTVKAITVEQAMGRREYFFDLVRIRKLADICNEIRSSYDPLSSTPVDDRTVFSQLENDLICLQTKVKFWEQIQELFIPKHKTHSKSKKV